VKHKQRKDRRAGSVLVFTTISTTLLLAMSGLAVDASQMYYTRSQMQAAVDAAALAGAWEVRYRELNNITAAARDGAAQNGFQNGVDGIKVTVNHPPTSGVRAGNQRFVEVFLEKAEPTYFLRVIGVSKATIVTRAVAGTSPHPACIYALDPSASSALTVDGTTLVAAQCGVSVTSKSSQAMVFTGSGCMTAKNYDVAGGVSIGKCDPGATPRTGVQPEPDPLAHVAPPSVGGCNFTNFSLGGSTGNATLSPGVYCNGIRISGGNITLNPGTYILSGGGLTIEGTSARLQGSGVTFFNTQANGYAYKPVYFAGQSGSNLSAPLSGNLQGVLFYQDRNVGAGTTNNFVGGSDTSFTGALYFPNSEVRYAGGSASAATETTLIGRKVTFTGNSAFKATSENAAVVSVRLVE
jgi:Flp pilus assembly protein TadG